MKKERLQKYMARCGASSRRGAEKLIAEGRVKVNGELVGEKVSLVDPETDKVEVDGKILSPPDQFIYYALNKPVGYVSTVEDNHAENTVVDLIPDEPRAYPVGRLDRDSEGLIILTNDGDLTLKLTHPRYEHEKEYEVTATSREPLLVRQIREKLEAMRKGIELEEGTTLPAEVKLLQAEREMIRFSIILKEGKKRQIRRMCRSLDLMVQKLVRIRIESLHLGDLKTGTWRKIKKEDIL